MKKLLMVSILVLITSCGVNTSSNINFNPTDIQIVRKGDLCFGYVASRRSFSMDTSGFGITYIPCEKLKGLTNVYNED